MMVQPVDWQRFKETPSSFVVRVGEHPKCAVAITEKLQTRAVLISFEDFAEIVRGGEIPREWVQYVAAQEE